MKNPKTDIQTIDAWNHIVPTYEVTNDGIQDAEGLLLQLCRGNKDNVQDPRQHGFFTESLLEVARRYLIEVNVPPLNSRETSMAITHIDEALMWIQKRADDRKARGVQGSYQK